MLLLTGPPGSGKTFRILERLREALRRRDSGVRLLTPTATMAQHLQNGIAHEGFVFRPGLIQTLSRFVAAFAADTPQVSEPLLYLIVEEAASRVKRPEFARVVRMPGFCAALARTIEEFSSAGCDAERLAAGLPRQRGAAPLGEAFLAVYREVDRELLRRRMATRSQQLLHAADSMDRTGLAGVHTVWLDGFYALPDPELAVIAAMSRHADVTLTLPTTEITEPTRQRLLAMGFVEEACAWKRAPVRMELSEAPSIERGADEIARRILEQSAAGRTFREMGVVVRSPEIYEQVLRATLDRFGIPARFYFDAELDKHALIRYLAGIVDALLDGWDHAATLAAIRLAPGIACDEFDFAVREQMPGSGLAALNLIAAERAKPLLDMLQSFAGLDELRSLVLPSNEWATRMKGMRGLFTPGQPEPGSYEIAAMARSQATALALFDGAMDEAAQALEDRPVSLAEFWRVAKSVLRLTPIRNHDVRRNVVHVLGAHEARQWRLPVVFLCGLVEKQFPKFHTQDPFFPDLARTQLQQAGIRLRSGAAFEQEERFLFDCALTRATESLTLSYPRFDGRGQQNLPSLYLDSLGLVASPSQAPPALPARHAGERPLASITTSGLLETLRQRHQVFRPTALESYLQCAFQFFGRDTLRLRAAPLRPEERLDYRLQGTIVHAVLAEFQRDARPLDETFDRVFRRLCDKYHVPSGYRTEACRERMLKDLRALVEDRDWTLGYEIRTEQDFRYKLTPDVEISGRIDRVDVTPDGRAFVIDYKYSGAQYTKDRATDPNLLQSQLYLLAMERSYDLRPEGMAYWGFKGGIQRTPFVPFGPAQAIETTLRIASEVRAGRVTPHPANLDKCRLCDLRDVCRYVAQAALAEGAPAWD